jgi:hypothetical protein
MKTINCYWELANLDCRVAEVSIETGDSFSEEILFDLEKNYDYIVLKFAVADYNHYLWATKHQYAFIETQLSLQKRMKDWHLSPADSRLLKNFSIMDVNDLSGLNKVLDKIDENMFTTDRIYLDPVFGPKYSTRRYKNWIRSAFERGASLQKFLFRNKEIGFGIARIEDNVMYGILGGLYSGMGLGIIAPTYPLLYEKKDFEWFRPKISMNNTPVLRLYNHFNFEITNVEYVFVKHISHI